MTPPAKTDCITVEILGKVLNETLEEKLEEKLRFVKEIHNATKIWKTKVTKIEVNVRALKNCCRCHNVVISGISYQENENSIEVAIRAGELVGVSLEARDIDSAHRLRCRNDKLPLPYKKIEISQGREKLNQRWKD